MVCSVRGLSRHCSTNHQEHALSCNCTRSGTDSGFRSAGFYMLQDVADTGDTDRDCMHELQKQVQSCIIQFFNFHSSCNRVESGTILVTHTQAFRNAQTLVCYRKPEYKASTTHHSAFIPMHPIPCSSKFFRTLFLEILKKLQLREIFAVLIFMNAQHASFSEQWPIKFCGFYFY